MDLSSCRQRKCHAVLVAVAACRPCRMRFGRFLLRFSYRGQPKTCRLCNSPDHLAQSCSRVVCFNCDQHGHVAKNCPDSVLCSICKSPEDFSAHCSHSWLRRKLASLESAQLHDEQEVQSNDDHPSDSEYVPSDRDSLSSDEMDDDKDNEDDDADHNVDADPGDNGDDVPPASEIEPMDTPASPKSALLHLPTLNLYPTMLLLLTLMLLLLTPTLSLLR